MDGGPEGIAATTRAQLGRKHSMRVMRKPTKTPKQREDVSNSVKDGHLRSPVAEVLSESKTRKRVSLEAIETVVRL